MLVAQTLPGIGYILRRKNRVWIRTQVRPEYMPTFGLTLGWPPYRMYVICLTWARPQHPTYHVLPTITTGVLIRKLVSFLHSAKCCIAGTDTFFLPFFQRWAKADNCAIFCLISCIFPEASGYLLPNIIRFGQYYNWWGLLGGTDIPIWFYR